MEDKIIESIAYILPAAVTGFVAYYMFNGVIKQQITERKMAILAQNKKDTLPTKLQAYERMLLFCDRINPVKILVRITPISDDTNAYLNLLLANIEQEFEHNLVQQIYISNESWLTILTAKNTVINILKDTAKTAETANDLREKVLIQFSTTIPPTENAIYSIKDEVRQLL